MDAAYLDRLVDAFTELQRRERRTDLDFAEITRRVSAILKRDVPSQTVGRWMRGKVQPRDPQERKAFAVALGTTVGALFYAEGTKKPAEVAGEQDFTVGAVALTAAQKARAQEKAAEARAARLAATNAPHARPQRGGGKG